MPLKLDYVLEPLVILLKGSFWLHSSWVEPGFCVPYQLACDVNTEDHENSKDSAQAPEPSTLDSQPAVLLNRCDLEQLTSL